ncbi:MAG: DNA polymerase III subunit [Acidobacteria bacterium]|nr:DNA polymerase III subunit [Acidobacteriota bacterium]
MPFREIAGHRRVLALLSRAVARGTLPPSLLLAGPQGVGKRRTAVAVAEALNCLQPQTSHAVAEGHLTAHSPRGGDPAAALQVADGFEIDACGACGSCRRIARGAHSDVIGIEPGDMGSIKIEQVRDVIDRAAYRPFEGRRRVVIVDEADALVPAAQNALLKTLEEPHPASVFVLVSSMPDALLATVRSRCPRLRFGPLPASVVADALRRDHGYTEAEARAAAADADGSIGCALAARSVDLTEARAAAQRLLEQAARVADPVRRLEAAKALTARPGPRPAAERDQLAAVLRVLASLLRDLGLLAVQAGSGETLANMDLHADLTRLTSAYDSNRSQRAFGAVDRALGALERNVSPKVVADWLCLQL